jgi:hypothetical protein
MHGREWRGWRGRDRVVWKWWGGITVDYVWYASMITSYIGLNIFKEIKYFENFQFLGRTVA